MEFQKDLEGFRRYLYDQIDWSQRLIAIVGARGCGKTTLVLQHYLKDINDPKRCLYISADSPLVYQSSLYEIGSHFFMGGGEIFIVDEVHKQENWSLDIKALYDSFPGKKMVILGSSKLNLLGQKGDLSRRMLIYHLKGLSFREYLAIKKGLSMTPVSFSELLKNHTDMSRELLRDHPAILQDFSSFCSHGHYPFTLDIQPEQYYQLLQGTLDKVIYEDLPSLSPLRSSSFPKLKRLMAYIAQRTVPTFQIAGMTNELDISKDTLYEYMDILDRAELLNIVPKRHDKKSSLKNAKVFFASPNTYFTLAEQQWKHHPEKGNLREAFFASQLQNIVPCFTSSKLDFEVEDGGSIYEIEIGGINKKNRQTRDIEQAYIFKEGLDVGGGSHIPLYLAGMLY